LNESSTVKHIGKDALVHELVKIFS